VRAEPVKPTWRLGQAGSFRHRVRLVFADQPPVLIVIRPVQETVGMLNQACEADTRTD
jgi:hypothetical protein